MLRSLATVALAVSSLFSFVPAQSLVVRTMPGYPNAPKISPQERHPVRPGTEVVVWGNAEVAAGASYTWSFSSNPNVRVIEDADGLGGSIADPRFVAEIVTFDLLNGSTKENIDATLVVDDGQGGSGSRTVSIVIIDPADPDSVDELDDQAIDVDIAIQNGLRYLYLQQRTDGSWQSQGSTYPYASSGFALWALQNQGHLPSNPVEEDILALPVQRGLDFILRSGTIRTDLSAPRADVARGAIADGISDLNGNEKTILIAGSDNGVHGIRPGYSTPIACAAIVASNAPDRVVQLEAGHPLNGLTYREVVEDVIDWFGAEQAAGAGAWGGRGGWCYTPTSTSNCSDLSCNSWFYLSMEGAEAIFGIDVPDWIKQECEYGLVAHQTDADVANGVPFGYRDANGGKPALVGGGLSGLALVETAGPFVTGGQIIAGSTHLDTIDERRDSAIRWLASQWNSLGNANSWQGGNFRNLYAMWTNARGLRLTATARGLRTGENLKLTIGGVDFDWATGMEYDALGDPIGLADSSSPRRGYFQYLLEDMPQVATGAIAERGSWVLGTQLAPMLDTALAVLVLTPRVFVEPCPGQISVDVTQLAPARDSQLPVGANVVLTGVAEAQSPLRPLAAVLVNGEPVDSLDVSGRFFKRVTIHEGANEFAIDSIERCGTARTIHRVFGVPDDDMGFRNLVDVTSSIDVRFQRTTFNRNNSSLLFDAQICNQGNFPLDGPVLGIVERFSSASHAAINPDGHTAEGRPFWIFLPQGADALTPGSCGPTRRLIVHAPDRRRVDLEFTWLALGNTAPYFVSVPPTAASIGQTWDYQAEARDDEGHALTYSLAVGPAGMTIDAGTGHALWTPGADQRGLYQIVLEVRDTRGGTGRQEFAIDTGNARSNRPPSFTTAPPTHVAVGGSWSYAAGADDPDRDALVFDKLAGPAEMTVAPNGAARWPFALPGDHPVTIRVRDARGAEATQSFVLTAGDRASNPNAPTLFGTPPTLAAVGGLYIHQPFAFDPDQGQTLTFSLLARPTGMEIDSMTGRIDWIPGGSQVGRHAVRLQVDDGAGGSAVQSWEIEVTIDSRNRAPVFVTVPPLGAEVGVDYVYVAQADDPDQDAVTYDLVQAPPGLTVDGQTGRVVWRPATVGRFTVALRARDTNGAAGAQVFEIRVGPANGDPTITSTAPASVTVGGIYRYQVNANDPDNDPLEFRMVRSPDGMEIHPRGGQVSWSPDTTGSFTAEIEVLDGRGGRATQPFSVQVLDDTTAPTVEILTASTQVAIGSTVRVRVGATDDVGVVDRTLTVDGNPLTLDAGGWATFDVTEVRTYALAATARDAVGNVGHDSLDVDGFDPATGAPGITLIAPAPGTRIDRPIDIVATVETTGSGGQLDWELRLMRTGIPGATVLASGSGPVTGGTLGRVDPTLLPNDSYTVEIVATENGFRRSFTFPAEVAGDFKLGNYTVQMQDLTLPVGGIPLSIVRSYDSLDTRVGDFGAGWRLSLPGDVRDSAAEGGSRPEPFNAGTRVYVTKPDGSRIGFRFRPESIGGPFGFLLEAKFEAEDDDEESTLELTYEAFVVVSGGQFFDIFTPFNPSTYVFTDADGLRYTIDEVDGLQLIEDVFGNTVTVTPAGVVSSLGARLDFVRDAQGRIERIIEPELEPGRARGELRYEYDAAGNLVASRNQLDQRTVYRYGQVGFPNYLTAIEDPSGKPYVRNVYGPDGRICAQCGPGGDPATLVGCRQLNLDPDATLQVVIDNRGNRIEYELDPRGNAVKERHFTDGTNFLETVRSYDASGRLLSETDPEGNTLSMTWSDEGKLLTRTEGGRTWSYTYNDCGKVETETDPGGNVTRYAYNDDCKLRFVTDPLGGVMEIRYNSFGAPSELIDPMRNTWRFEYDAFGQRNRVIDPAGGELRCRYTLAGELLWQIDPEGRRIDYTYDANHRPLTETWDTASPYVIAFEYDAAGHVIRATAPDSVTNVEYWPTGKIKKVDNAGTPGIPYWEVVYGDAVTNGPGGAVSTGAVGLPGRGRPAGAASGWDANGNLELVTDSFGGRTRYEYDALNRIAGVVQNGAGIDTKAVSFGWRSSSLLASVERFRDAGRTQLVSSTLYDYDCGRCSSRVSDIHHLAAGGATIDRISFVRDALANLAIMTDRHGTHRFQGDGKGQLLEVDHPDGFAGGDERYRYDAAGNRIESHLSSSYRYGYQVGSGGNHLVQDDAWNYVYDLVGNLTAKTSRGSAERFEYDYDHRNRLVGVRQWDAGGAMAHTVAYRYDPLGRRIATVEDGMSWFYAYDGSHPIVVFDPASNVIERRLYSREQDSLLAVERGGSTWWALKDHLGTPAIWQSHDGSTVDRIDYDGFGQVVAGAGGGGGTRLGLHGHEFNPWSGLGHYVNRAYQPSLGRFLQVDQEVPFRYEFVNNRPTLLLDPDGRTALIGYACGLGATVVGVAQWGLVIGNLWYAVVDALFGNGSPDTVMSAVQAIADTFNGQGVLKTAIGGIVGNISGIGACAAFLFNIPC